MFASVWIERAAVLGISLVIASIGNYIVTNASGSATPPLEALPGLLILAGCVIAGELLHSIAGRILSGNLPDIVYISAVAISISIPGLFPFSDVCIARMDQIDLMSLITVLMAYTGISIGKDLGTFKQQGVAIIIVALITFFSTFVGSVLIGEAVLHMTGVI